jgi:hypothetical protein
MIGYMTESLISKDQFARAVGAFFMEASGMLMVDPPKILAANESLRNELLESLDLIRDPSTTPESVVSLAFGIVDEYVHADFENLVSEAYALYLDMNGGASRRNPNHPAFEAGDGV